MDRRQAKTRKAILNAFYELLSEKTADKITVTEISELADIGKSTFYTHFETKEYLIEYICSEFFSHLKEHENTDLYPNLEQMLVHLLWHINDQKNNILKLIKEENPICNRYFVEYLKGIFANYLKADKNLNAEFALNHIVESFISALRWHMNNPMILNFEKLVRDFMFFNSALL